MQDDKVVVSLFGNKNVHAKPKAGDSRKRSIEDMTPENDHKKLADKLGISLEEAEKVVYDFYVTYPAAIELARLKISPNYKG